jgi:hypothetical protein
MRGRRGAGAQRKRGRIRASMFAVADYPVAAPPGPARQKHPAPRGAFLAAARPGPPRAARPRPAPRGAGPAGARRGRALGRAARAPAAAPPRARRPPRAPPRGALGSPSLKRAPWPPQPCCLQTDQPGLVMLAGEGGVRDGGGGGRDGGRRRGPGGPSEPASGRAVRCGGPRRRGRGFIWGWGWGFFCGGGEAGREERGGQAPQRGSGKGWGRGLGFGVPGAYAGASKGRPARARGGRGPGPAARPALWSGAACTDVRRPMHLVEGPRARAALSAAACLWSRGCTGG